MRAGSLDKRVRPEVGMGSRYHEAMTSAIQVRRGAMELLLARIQEEKPAAGLHVLCGPETFANLRANLPN